MMSAQNRELHMHELRVTPFKPHREDGAHKLHTQQKEDNLLTNKATLF